MKVRSRILDRTLRKAEFGWKGLRFFKGTLLLGTAVALLVFLLGAAVVQKWVGSRQVFITLLAALASLSFLAWLLMLIRVAASHPDRGWLASIIERANRLQDRLNALVFLETSNEPQSRSFARHIGRQVQPMVQDPHYRAKPFYTRSTAGLALLFLAALAATTWFYDRYSPLARLNQKEARQPAEHAPRPPLNIPAPDAIDPE
ncbi:MAG TPA: hypothetical protein VN673_12245, partial [Clostridia bacterium]|nr:hypothetical protein [Clostridia bacterium]